MEDDVRFSKHPPVPVMDDSKKPIDDYTLAAFLAGTLPESRREEVIAYLAANEHARELLRMAYQALESSQSTEDPPIPLPAEIFSIQPSRKDRKPLRRIWRQPVYTRVAAFVVFFAVLGIGLQWVLKPAEDRLRDSNERDLIEVEISGSKSNLSLEWNRIPEAYQYHVVIWNPEDALMVTEYTTKKNEIGRDDPGVQELRDLLEVDQKYSLRVDAFDAQNRLIISSEMIGFELSR